MGIDCLLHAPPYIEDFEKPIQSLSIFKPTCPHDEFPLKCRARKDQISASLVASLEYKFKSGLKLR